MTPHPQLLSAALKKRQLLFDSRHAFGLVNNTCDSKTRPPMRHNNQQCRETRRRLEYVIPLTKWRQPFVTPQSRGYRDVTATYIRGQKYPHVYTLSINISNNQSLKICGELYIPTYEYYYKVITRCDTILQEYYITDRRNCENTRRYKSMNSAKGAHELQ